MPVDVAVDRQQSVRDPAHPSYIFRGHTAQIHSVELARRNTCLLTGDADGWVVCWKLETKRPLAVWRAHDAAILGTAAWGPEKILTHGRDNTLRIWQLGAAHASYSTVLPADGPDTHRSKPWLLHTLPVNTLNFCAFSMCYQRPGVAASDAAPGEPIYVAVPGRDDKKADVYQFPDEKLVCVVPRIDASETGMVMAVKLVHHRPSRNILLITGYEGGLAAAHVVPRHGRDPALGLAQTIYLSQPHTQPILSIDALPDGSTFFSSSADALIAAHRIPELPSDGHDVPANPEDAALDAGNQHHEAKSQVEDASDIPSGASNSKDAALGTTPPPSQSTKTSNKDDESSVPLSFPKVPSVTAPGPDLNNGRSAAPFSGLSKLLASAPPQPNLTPTVRRPTIAIQPAHKTVGTKHAGQQSLRVRSDGRLFVTGGWDSRVRVYSTKTLKEVAVLKWHKEGIYAADFGEVLEREDLHRPAGGQEASEAGEETKVVKRETGLAKLQRQREEAVQLKHWVAAGAKDGKVSLWEVF